MSDTSTSTAVAETQSATTAQIPAETPSSGAPPAVPAESFEQLELQRLRNENAELKQQQADRQQDDRVKQAVASTRVQNIGPSLGQQAMRRQRAIAATGSFSAWNKIPVGERVNILTDGQRVPATTEEIGKYFGPKSSANAAVQLKASNPGAYTSYRAEAVELGLIG